MKLITIKGSRPSGHCCSSGTSGTVPLYIRPVSYTMAFTSQQVWAATQWALPCSWQPAVTHLLGRKEHTLFGVLLFTSNRTEDMWSTRTKEKVRRRCAIFGLKPSILKLRCGNVLLHMSENLTTFMPPPTLTPCTPTLRVVIECVLEN